MGSRVTLALAVVLLLAVGGVAASSFGLLPVGDYDHTTVTIADNATHDTLATVRVRIADTPSKRYTGLSDTESLGKNEGMLFIHDTESSHAYVMRDMAFPLDIVFVDADGTITSVHHAPLPDEATSNGDLKRYRGTGKYVLELPYKYTEDNGIAVGDIVEINRPSTTAT